MILRLAGDDIAEVRRALCSAYQEVIRDLGRFGGIGGGPVGIQLCRRRSKLEAMLRQLDGPQEPPPALSIVPRQVCSTQELIAA